MKLKQVALIGSVIICVFATSALAAQMSVEPVHQEDFQGDNITVNITVATEGAENVYAASYTLYFNKTLLNAISLDKGPFLSQDGNPSNVQDPPTEINNTAGEIKYGECKVGDVPGTTGYGVLTTIVFQVIGEGGISQLNLGDLNLALLYSAPPEYVPVPTTLDNGTCEIMIKQTPTSTSPTTTTSVTAPVQTPTTIPITPASTATVIRTPATLSSPSPSPPSTIITSPTTTASKPPSEEESEENNKLSGFKAVFTITGLFMLLILKRRNVRE